MIHTESKLWSDLKCYSDNFTSLARIESEITPGASDVEYVSHKYHGWIELKTSNAPRPGKRFSLHSPFTPTQAQWLVDHNNPKRFLRSYLMIGVIGPRTWKEYWLMEPDASVSLIAGMVGVPHEDLRSRSNVWVYNDLEDLVRKIRFP